MREKRNNTIDVENIIAKVIVIFTPIFTLGCIAGWKMHKLVVEDNDSTNKNKEKDYIDADFTY